MNAIMDVDQGAAIIMTSVLEAKRLGIPEERWVYLSGCGDATDHWFISERVDYASSPAIRAAGERALSMAGVEIDAVQHFDIYSCFPSAVQISRGMLGIAADDERPLTVTGGLPYFGGPGNNYSSHAIAAMTRRLRASRGDIGLVTANGWYVTKHSVGIYSATPPPGPWRRTPVKEYQALIDAEAAPRCVGEPTGIAVVETYTVLFDRDGGPETGIVIGRDREGRRFIANTPRDRSTLEAMVTREMVGAKGHVAADDGRNVFSPT